jgi:23S rRNA (adenine2503-C2)-methyltransferase
LTDPNGLAFGSRHITISTSGCIEGIEKLIQEGSKSPNLAVSVNAPEDAVRNRLMPINRKQDMQKLYAVMHRYCHETKRQILIAYVLLKDCNDSLEHADLLADYLQGLDVKVNLIPYNAQSCDRYLPPDKNVIEAFTKRLRDKGYYTLLRMTKGRGIMAACGQLGNVELRKKKRELNILKALDQEDREK